jgi:hypothetical protein
VPRYRTWNGEPLSGIGDRAFAERRAGELAAMAELAQRVVEGGIGQDEAIRRSPFPVETTQRALERAAPELVEVMA